MVCRWAVGRAASFCCGRECCPGEGARVGLALGHELTQRRTFTLSPLHLPETRRVRLVTSALFECTPASRRLPLSGFLLCFALLVHGHYFLTTARRILLCLLGRGTGKDRRGAKVRARNTVEVAKTTTTARGVARPFRQCPSRLERRGAEFALGLVPDKQSEVAALLVSELATNAVLHSGESPFEVRVRSVPDRTSRGPRCQHRAPGSA